MYEPAAFVTHYSSVWFGLAFVIRGDGIIAVSLNTDSGP